MKTRRLAAFILAFTTVFGLWGCKKTEPEPTPVIETEINDPNILTHIYREAARTKDAVRMAYNFTPYYDRETKTLTYLCRTTEDYGEDSAVFGYSLRSLSPDGEERVIADFTLTDEWIFGGFAEEDGAVCELSSQDESGNRKASIGVYDAKTGAWTSRTDDVLHLFEDRPIGIRGPIRDKSGHYLVSAESGSEILVLAEDGSFIRRFRPETGGYDVSGFVSSEDGRIFASMATSNLRHMAAEVFPDEGTIGTPVSAGQNLFGGVGGDSYYYSTNDGIFTVSEDGGERMLLSYINSGLSWAEASPLYVSPDAVYLSEFSAMGSRYEGAPVSLYVPGEDIDLREQQVLTLAYFDYMTTSMTAAVNSFNKTHPEARIVTEDWAVYNNDQNPMGGYEKLARDLVTGTAAPDILVGIPGQRQMKAAVEHGLYLDLMPYVQKDDFVSSENLFGCVKRLFDDGKGGLWGITPNFQVSQTIVSTPAYLGEYAEKGYWTISELLDYIDALPEDVTFMTGLYRTRWQVLPLLDYGNGYMAFVDREAGTCSFDSPAFIRWLNFAKALPTQDEYNARSPYAGMDEEALAEPRRNGLIRAASTAGYLVAKQLRRLMMVFSTKDWTMIGYPAAVERDGAGTCVTSTNAIIISASCPAPDLAWDFLRRCFTSDEEQGGIPALKTTFDGMVEEWYGLQFEDYYVLHDYNWTSRPMENAITEDDLMYPGMLSTFDRADRDKFAALFDKIGVTPEEQGVQEIYDILFEEVSAFYSGVGSAEDCAAKIQSRVSIWLAENR